MELIRDNKIIFIDNVPVKVLKTINGKFDEHFEIILKIANSLCPEYIIDKNNLKIIELLLFYFTGSDLFYSHYREYTGNEGRLNKGIALIGDVGAGKSLLFEIFKQYTKHVLQQNSFIVTNENEIINKVHDGGIEAINDLGYNFNTPKTIYIDDFASKIEESKIKHYGSKLDVIDNLLTTRYIIYTRYYKLTHISTNSYPIDWAKMFDNRIVDRMVEMFNIIELQGNSRRI
jgi:DNA replication protein DnaC